MEKHYSGLSYVFPVFSSPFLYSEIASSEIGACKLSQIHTNSSMESAIHNLKDEKDGKSTSPFKI